MCAGCFVWGIGNFLIQLALFLVRIIVLIFMIYIIVVGGSFLFWKGYGFFKNSNTPTFSLPSPSDNIKDKKNTDYLDSEKRINDAINELNTSLLG